MPEFFSQIEYKNKQRILSFFQRSHFYWPYREMKAHKNTLTFHKSCHMIKTKSELRLKKFLPTKTHSKERRTLPNSMDDKEVDFVVFESCKDHGSNKFVEKINVSSPPDDYRSGGGGGGSSTDKLPVTTAQQTNKSPKILLETEKITVLVSTTTDIKNRESDCLVETTVVDIQAEESKMQSAVKCHVATIDSEPVELLNEAKKKEMSSKIENKIIGTNLGNQSNFPINLDEDGKINEISFHQRDLEDVTGTTGQNVFPHTPENQDKNGFGKLLMDCKNENQLNQVKHFSSKNHSPATNHGTIVDKEKPKSSSSSRTCKRASRKSDFANNNQHRQQSLMKTATKYNQDSLSRIDTVAGNSGSGNDTRLSQRSAIVIPPKTPPSKSASRPLRNRTKYLQSQRKGSKLKDSVISKSSLSVIKKPTLSDCTGMLGKHFANSKSGHLDGVQSQPDFQFISDELNFLNLESGKLATQLHKSDKQKRLERKRKGSFIRSILKKNLGAKRSRKSERTANPPPEKSDTESSELDLEIDSSSDFEFEMDRRLEENARKNNLSVMNVKSILHTVITNEHVVAMMNNTLKSAGEVEGEFIEAVYEPKMTRSKIKEVLKKSDGMAPWPLPSNKMSESNVSILDIPFNEDEEDDDYNPEKDITAEIESDEDTESLNSSLSSSPNLHLMKSSMTTMTENRKLTETDDEDKKEDMTEETIARRTRSKLPLHDTSLTEIEAHFVAPDITEDMYDTECNDKEWKDFLKSLTKSQDVEDPSEALDDEVNDPEYNYLAEAENELPDDEDFRNDRLVRVSKKELHGLLDELFNEDANEEEEEETVLQPSIATGADISDFGQPSNVDITVTPEQSLIIAEHVKQHTQLLCQLALLTHGQEVYINESNQCIKFLRELQMFGNQSPAREKSVFLASNLEGSLKVIEEFQPSINKRNYSKTLSEDLKKLFVGKPNTFLYSPLLPVCGSIHKSKFGNTTFFPAHDNLLALGFEQFRHFKSFKRCMYIRQLLTPCKTEKQIRARLKNLRSKRASDNPVKAVAQTNNLPEDFLTATLSQAQGLLSPEGSSPHPDAPNWYKLIIDPSPSKKTSVPTRKAAKPNSRRKQVHSKKLVGSNLQTSKKEKLVLSSPTTLAITGVNLVPTGGKEVSQNVHLMSGGTTFEVILSDFRPGQLSSNTTTTPAKITSPLVSFEQRDSSPNQDKSDSPDPVANSSIDVIATVASQLLSKSNSIVSARNPAFISEALAKQKELQKTPTKNLLPVYETAQTKGLSSSKTSAVFKHLAPKPQQISPPGCRQVSLCLEKKHSSPRRQKLQQKARLICPKSVLIKPHFSPTSMAAYGLRKRAKRSPRMTTRNAEPQTILPKTITQSAGLENACCNLSTKRLKEVLPLNQRSPVSLRHSKNTLTKNLNDSGSNIKKDDWLGPKMVEKASPAAVATSQTEETDTAGTASSGITSGSCCQSENENCLLENGDSHIADLMAASSTIGCHQKRGKDTRTKAQKRNDIKLAMLAPNLIEKDPRRDHRDTIFALAYLNKVKETLKTDIERYEQFLRILFEFGKSDHSPVVLYKNLSYLMKDYPELVHDFAAFLSPEHALLCGCYKTTVDFLRARNFLRKIEIIFEKHPSQYQKVLRIFAEWQRKVTHKEEELHEMLLPMFKGQDELLAECSGLFGFQPPPESQPEDFEEVTLEGGESEFKNKLMGYEDVELPDAANQYGMPGCPCQCHNDKDKLPTDGLNKKKTKSKRVSHCSLCGLTVKDGKLYFKTTGKLKHVRAKISEPFDLSDSEKESNSEDPIILLGDTKLDCEDHSVNVCKDGNNESVRSPTLPKDTSLNKEISSSTNDSSVAVPMSEGQNTQLKSHENDKVDSSPNRAKSDDNCVSVDKCVGFPNSDETLTNISNTASNDILAKAWEQACRSPTDSIEPDDSLHDFLHIPVNQNQPKNVVSGVGPSMPADFLLPSQPNLSAIPTVISSTTVTHQLPVSNLTVIPLSTVNVQPQLNQITLPTFSHLIPNFNHHNGTLLSKNKSWQLSKVEKRGAIDNLLNSAVLSKKHLQVITPNSNDYTNQQAISNQLFSEGTNIATRWTKWMDKTILDSVRKDGGSAQVFERLSGTINGRTPKQIKERYSDLLQLLEQMKR